ncbi:MAG: hypothetical protein Kow00124_13310 [Anaerolineae bacterium]
MLQAVLPLTVACFAEREPAGALRQQLPLWAIVLIIVGALLLCGFLLCLLVILMLVLLGPVIGETFSNIVYDL